MILKNVLPKIVANIIKLTCIPVEISVVISDRPAKLS